MHKAHKRLFRLTLCVLWEKHYYFRDTDSVGIGAPFLFAVIYSDTNGSPSISAPFQFCIYPSVFYKALIPIHRKINVCQSINLIERSYLSQKNLCRSSITASLPPSLFGKVTVDGVIFRTATFWECVLGIDLNPILRRPILASRLI